MHRRLRPAGTSLHGAGTITQPMVDYIQYTGIARGLFPAADLAVEPDWRGGASAGRAVGSGGWSLLRAGRRGLTFPDPMTASGNTTGSKAFPTEGSYSVRALYAETQLPIYQAGAVSLDATAAGRAFDYDTFGGGFNL